MTSVYDFSGETTRKRQKEIMRHRGRLIMALTSVDELDPNGTLATDLRSLNEALHTEWLRIENALR